MSMELADAVAAYTSGVDALLNADVDTSSHKELLAHFAAVETATRRVPSIGYAILARLDREAVVTDLGATSLWSLIARRCRLSRGDAQGRIARAKLLGPRRTLQGQPLAPQWTHTAAAVADGAIGAEHVDKIAKFFTALPSSVDFAAREGFEATLAGVARDLDPAGLETAANRLLALVHPDGDEPNDEVERKIGLRMGKQQPDGLSWMSGWVSPLLRGLVEPVTTKFKQQGRRRRLGDLVDDVSDTDGTDTDGVPTPREQTLFDQDDDESGTGGAESGTARGDTSGPADTCDPWGSSDPPPALAGGPVIDGQGRTAARYLHDAIATALDMLLRSQTLGKLNGLPCTMVVTTSLDQLTAGAGYAVTGGGTRIPMRDLIALAGRGAYHYLAVFDDHTSETLHLGRAKRCATGAQKLALFGRERGCSCPGCTAAFYDTQAHHGVTDWKHGGQTNINDLTLGCGPDHQLTELTEWTTRRREDGRFEWIAPEHLEHGQPRVNDLHHPERLLKPKDKPKDDEEEPG